MIKNTNEVEQINMHDNTQTMLKYKNVYLLSNKKLVKYIKVHSFEILFQTFYRRIINKERFSLYNRLTSYNNKLFLNTENV